MGPARRPLAAHRDGIKGCNLHGAELAVSGAQQRFAGIPGVPGIGSTSARPRSITSRAGPHSS